MDKKPLSNIYLPLLLVLAGLAVYSNAFSGPFVFDDRPFIVENEWIKSLSNFVRPAGMRYVGDLSYAINYHLGGLDTFGYHLVNISIHLLNSVLVFFLVGGLFFTPVLKRAREQAGGFTPHLAAFPVAAVFLAHPVQIQAVTYISQRYTSLAVFFYLASLLCFLAARRYSLEGGPGPRRAVYYASSIVFAVLAMKTKEISFTLPFVMLLLEAAVFGREDLRGREDFKRRAVRLIPFFIVALIIPVSLILPEFGIMRTGSSVEELMRAHKIEEASGISRYAYLLTQSKVVVTYIRLFFFPVHKGFVYHFPIEGSLADPAVLASSVALLIIMALAALIFVRSLKRTGIWPLLASIGLIWFFVTLSVESSVIPIKDAFNERRLYLPSVGLSLSTVSALFYCRELLCARYRLRIGAGAVTLFVLVAVVAPLGALTHARNELWNDRLSLYAEEARKSPYSSSTHMYLGIEYFNRGETDKALEEFITAKRLNPSSVYVRRILAKFYVNTGDYRAAVRETEEILDIEPDNTEARYNLGVLFMSIGRLDEAEAELRKLLERDSTDAHARRALERLESLRDGAAIGRKK